MYNYKIKTSFFSPEVPKAKASLLKTKNMDKLQEHLCEDLLLECYFTISEKEKKILLTIFSV